VDVCSVHQCLLTMTALLEARDGIAFDSFPFLRHVQRTKAVDFLSKALPDALFVVLADDVVDGKSSPCCVLVDVSIASENVALCWFPREQLPALVSDINDASEATPTGYLEPRHLGVKDGIHRFSVDCSAYSDSGFASNVPDGVKRTLQPIRQLMVHELLPQPELSVVGVAHALERWHRTVKFCSLTGAPTNPCEGGLRRKAPKGPKAYPRTDPVAITLVVDNEYDRCLLGRYQTASPGLYTCLAGFAELAETLEEAAAREVLEESGVELTSLRLLMSQAWPIGRAGSCEMMIGAIATADCTRPVKCDESEMADVKWFSKDEVRLALERKVPRKDGLLHHPGKYALAHHLIAGWVHETLIGEDSKL